VIEEVLILYVLMPVAAYSLGGVPFGLILCQVIKGVDIREHGSRNIGATNAGRVCGWPFFVAAFALDFGKGLATVLIGGVFADAFAPPDAVAWLRILYGALAILGHTFPAYLRLRGGKAVATSFGVFVAFAPIATGIALGAWAVVFLAFRYVSLASMTAAVTIPIAYAVRHRADLDGHLPVLCFAGLIALLVIVRHRANIRRLLSGTENPFGRRSG